MSEESSGGGLKNAIIGLVTIIAFFNPPPELSSDITFSYCLLMNTGILTILPETSSRFKS